MEVVDAALTQWTHILNSSVESASTADEIREKQRQSLESKKKLAEDTKNFKRLPDSDKLGGVPELLKGYQVEVDALGKRAKFAEGAFLQLQQTLASAPGPSVVKEQLDALLAAQGAANLEERLRQKDVQIARLEEAAHDMDKEFSSVTNQAATVRALQKQIKEQEVICEDKLSEARRIKDEECSKKLDALQQDLTSQREAQLEALTQLSQQREAREDELHRLKRQHLEEHKLAEEQVLARSSEVDTLSQDIERLQGELERERLQRSEHKETQGSVAVLQSLLDGVQQRAAGVEREAADLRQQLSEADERQSQTDATAQSQLGQLAASTAGKDAEIRSLKEQLSLRPSFDDVSELKQRLKNVETVELADVEGAASDLERRLLFRQKELEGHLSEGRVQAQQREEEVDRLQRRLLATEDEAKDLKVLAQRLESQLGETSKTCELGAKPEASLAVLMPSAPNPGSDEGGCAGEARGSMPSMLEIVTGQRDRLRERLGDIEQERDQWKSASDQHLKRGDMMHADNVKLLERCRYLQSVQPKQGGIGRGQRGRGKPADADLESRYGAAYEDGLSVANPFQQFRADERARHQGGMNAGEKILVTAGTVLFASKPARMFTLVYFSTLHILVFLVLYRHAHLHTKHC